MKDDARQAVCDIATASRVLNKSGPAIPVVRTRIKTAARELGFAFSATGRALQSSRSMTIDSLVPLANPVVAESVHGVQGTLVQTGYQLRISCSNYDGQPDNRALSTLLSKDIDGLIVTMMAPFPANLSQRLVLLLPQA